MAKFDQDPLRAGSEVALKGRHFKILRYVDLSTVLAQDIDSGAHELLKAADILAVLAAEGDDALVSGGFEGLSEEEWQVASRRLAELEPLMQPGATREQAESTARQFDVHVATIYRWINEYKRTGNVASLAPSKPDGGRGKGRIDTLAEAIVSEAISELYLTKQRLSVA